ncbi:MAG: alternative oxidase [Candidatus Paceibacterota bacterium]
MIKEHNEDIEKHLQEVVPHVAIHEESYTYQPKSMSDIVARKLVRILAAIGDFLFQTRYCHRAVVLETIAAVPGMVGGLLQHLKSLRRIQDDRGWIQTLLDEAENERIHLLVYSELAKPTVGERFSIMIVQFFFYHIYFLVYLLSPKTAHRFVGFLEEEAVSSYEHYLRLVEEGVHENVPAPKLAISYWNLPLDAKLSDMIKATIKDEMIHRDVNHRFANDPIGATLWK